MKKKSFLSIAICTCIMSISMAYATGTSPIKRITHDVSLVPIKALPNISSEEPGWAKVRVIEQTDEDTYLVEDISGQIILFLSKDELLNLDIKPNQELLVRGKVDISPVSANRNELYAEEIYLPQIK